MVSGVVVCSIRCISLCLLLLFVVPQSYTETDTTRIVHDSITFVRPTRSGTFSDSTRRTTDTIGYHPTKDPWLAVGLSAAVPGLGQIYNKNYWKVPVLWGFGGYWVYEWIHLNNTYKDFRDQYSRSITQTEPLGNSQFLKLRDFYRDERDKFAWYLGALYFLNLVDAYVSAQLYDFDVSPDLGSGGGAMPRVTATIRWRF